MPDRGWVPAGQLHVGDWVHSHDGQWTPTTAVELTGSPAQVYNFRIADHHTYFVGDDDWGFSVWVHNSYVVEESVNGVVPRPRTWGAEKNFDGGNRTIGVLSWEKNGKTYFSELVSGEINAKHAGLSELLNGQNADNYHHVEAQAIKLMQAEQVSNARLVINNPNGVCRSCAPPGNRQLLGEGLGPGSILDVYKIKNGRIVPELTIFGKHRVS